MKRLFTNPKDYVPDNNEGREVRESREVEEVREVRGAKDVEEGREVRDAREAEVVQEVREACHDGVFFDLDNYYDDMT
jgi:hypothetical protein